VVDGARGFQGVGTTGGTGVAGVTLVRIRTQRAGKGTTLGTGAVVSTGGGITGVCDGCMVGSDAGMGGGSFLGMRSTDVLGEDVQQLTEVLPLTDGYW
jgi:hypothetical protein